MLQPRLSGAAWRRTSVACCVALNACIGSALTAALPGYLVVTLGANYVEASSILVASTVVTTAIIHVLGVVGDRPRCRYPLAVLSALCGALGALALAATADAWACLLALSTLLAVAASLFPQLLALAFVYDRAATSLVRAIASGGWVVGPMLGGLVALSSSASGLFAAIAGAYAVLALGLAIMWAMSETGGARGAPAGSQPHRAAERRGSLATAIATLSAMHVLLALFAVAVPWRLISLGGTAADVGSAFSIAAAIEVPVLACSGALQRSVGPGLLIVVAGLCLMVYFVVTAMAAQPALLLAACALDGLATGIMMGLSLLVLHDRLPDYPSRATSIYSNMIRLSYVGALVLAGGLAQAMGVEAVFWAASIFTLMLSIWLAVRQPIGALQTRSVGGIVLAAWRRR